MTIAIYFFVILFYVGQLMAQTEDPESLIDRIKDKLGSVNDYVVDVEVSLNMDFLKMPKSKAKLYYKNPDKFKFQSSGFAILPKAGIEFNPQRILNDEYNAVFIEDTVLSEPFHSLIQISPVSDSSRFLKANLLIDTNDYLLLELNLFSNNKSNIVTVFYYGNHKEYALPSGIKVSFNFSDDGELKENRRRRVPDNFKGSVEIKYYDYIINEGIDESVFEEGSDSEDQFDKKEIKN